MFRDLIVRNPNRAFVPFVPLRGYNKNLVTSCYKPEGPTPQETRLKDKKECYELEGPTPQETRQKARLEEQMEWAIQKIGF